MSSNFSTSGGGASGSGLSMSSNGLYGYGSSASNSINNSGFGKHSVPGINSRGLKGASSGSGGSSGNSLRASHIGSSDYRAALQAHHHHHHHQQQQSSTSHQSASNSLSGSGFGISNNQKYLYKGSSGKRWSLEKKEEEVEEKLI